MKRVLPALLWIGSVFWIVVAAALPITAQESTKTLEARVKVNVCGDGIVEKPAEQCEGQDLQNATCESVGMGPGTLSCDAACSYDISKCATPTPRPSPSIGVQVSPVPSNEQESIIILSPKPGFSTRMEIIINRIEELPATLLTLDIDKNGTIDNEEIIPGIKSWVDAWKAAIRQPIEEAKSIKLCDINSDKQCDVRDFSILLSYISN